MRTRPIWTVVQSWMGVRWLPRLYTLRATPKQPRLAAMPVGVSLAFTLPFSLPPFLSDLFRKETDEDKIIHQIKVSILAIRSQDFDTAEQLLHIALKSAQDTGNENAVTYIFDTLANMALHRGQFKKAEKLFIDVLRRYLADGMSTSDNIVSSCTQKSLLPLSIL